MPHPDDARRLSKGFARALHEIVLETEGGKGSQTVRKQLAELHELTRGEAGHFFGNPVFGVDEKTAALERILRKHHVDQKLERFLRLLVSLRCLKFLPEIAIAYSEAEDERKNEMKATIRTAFPLAEREKRRLAAALSKATGRVVSIDVQTDSSLIGGVVAEIGSVVHDASIRGYLDRLQEKA